MSVSALNSNRPQSVFLAFLLSLITVVIGALRDPFPLSSWTSNSPLFQVVPLPDSSLFHSICGAILVLLTANFYRYVCDKHRLFTASNQLSFVISTLFLTLSAAGSSFSALTIGGLLAISLLDYSFRIQESNKPNDLVFMGSLTVGAMSLVYTPFVFFLILIWVSFLYSGKIGLKGFFISLTGLVIPAYFLYGICFLIDLPVGLSFSFTPHFPSFQLRMMEWTVVLTIAMLMISGVGSLISTLNFNKVVIRNNYLLLLIFGLLSIVCGWNAQFGFWQSASLFSLFGAAYLTQHLLQQKKKWLSSALFYALLIVVWTHLLFQSV